MDEVWILKKLIELTKLCIQYEVTVKNTMPKEAFEVKKSLNQEDMLSPI